MVIDPKNGSRKAEAKVSRALAEAGIEASRKNGGLKINSADAPAAERLMREQRLPASFRSGDFRGDYGFD